MTQRLTAALDLESGGNMNLHSRQERVVVVVFFHFSKLPVQSFIPYETYEVNQHFVFFVAPLIVFLSPKQTEPAVICLWHVVDWISYAKPTVTVYVIVCMLSHDTEFWYRISSSVNFMGLEPFFYCQTTWGLTCFCLDVIGRGRGLLLSQASLLATQGLRKNYIYI